MVPLLGAGVARNRPLLVDTVIKPPPLLPAAREGVMVINEVLAPSAGTEAGERVAVTVQMFAAPAVVVVSRLLAAVRLAAASDPLTTPVMVNTQPVPSQAELLACVINTTLVPVSATDETVTVAAVLSTIAYALDADGSVKPVGKVRVCVVIAEAAEATTVTVQFSVRPAA